MSSLKKCAYCGYFDFILGIKIETKSFLILTNISSFAASLSALELDFGFIKSSCCVEITIASIRTGLLSSEYSKVTCDFASGRK